MNKRKSSTIKRRNWAFVVYPDSAPVDWIDQLQQTGLQCVISPLHDKDIDPTGEPKKAHYHVIVAYAGPTSYRIVEVLTDSLNAPGPQPLDQIRGYYRYLTHKDNPEKAQYDDQDGRTINGFDITNFIEFTKSEVNEFKRVLQDLIREKNIVEYSDFMDYLSDSGRFLEYDIASSNTYFFDRYIASRRNKFKLDDEQHVRVVRVDLETGEVIE